MFSVKQDVRFEGDKFASLRAAFDLCMVIRAKSFLFMGQEFAQKREWAEFRSLDWFLLEEDDRHKKNAGLRT